MSCLVIAWLSFFLLLHEQHRVVAIRLSSDTPRSSSTSPTATKTAIFALGSFWRSEAVFGCLPGVLRTTAGYAGGSKPYPQYRNIGDHAEAVEVEFDPQLVRYEQLLDIFWSSHDPTQVFGQGPDVGNQYRSAILFQGSEQESLASLSKSREEAKLADGVVTTEIKPVEAFVPAEPEHQKFELRRNQQLMQLFSNVAANEDMSASQVGSRLNAYAAGMCSLSSKKALDHLVNNYLKCKLNLGQLSRR